MRFLLNARKVATKKVQRVVQKNSAAQALAVGVGTESYSNSYNDEHVESEQVKAWGQHCSPNCGCAVRFEATIDHSTNQILSASYEAKTVITHFQSADGDRESTYLKPLLADSRRDKKNNGKPLMKSCQCKTLHGLSQRITEVLPQYSLQQAQNQLEYTGNRSSAAFRYIAMKKLGFNDSANSNTDLNSLSYGHCWDLVEDAITACLHGYLPKPRPIIYNEQHEKKRNMIQNAVQRTQVHENNDKPLDPLRFVRAAKSRAKEGIMKRFQKESTPNHSSSSIPPFHLMGDGHGASDTLTQLRMEIQTLKEKEATWIEDNSFANDWVDYVDEKYEKCSTSAE